MTEAEFDAQIAKNKEVIVGHQQEIRKLEEQIGELNAMKIQMTNLQDVLRDTAGRVEEKARGMNNLWGAVFSVLNGRLFVKIVSAAKGAEYRSADNGLSSSQEKIQNKINELRKLIDQMQSAIYTCNSNISSLQSEKAEYIEAKAQEEVAKANKEGS